MSLSTPRTYDTLIYTRTPQGYMIDLNLCSKIDAETNTEARDKIEPLVQKALSGELYRVVLRKWTNGVPQYIYDSRPKH